MEDVTAARTTCAVARGAAREALSTALSAALSELASPAMGIRTTTSQASRHAELMPEVSLPTTTPVPSDV